MSSDLFTGSHSVDSLTEELYEVGKYNPELRVSFEEKPEQVILDDCVVGDYLANRGRQAETARFADSYFEGPQDIERLLEEFPNDILVPERFQDVRPGKFRNRSVEDDIIQRISTLENNSEYIDIDRIEPREGFREFEHADIRDKRIAEESYETKAVVVTYDDDFLDFPVNYTTPGMLL